MERVAIRLIVVSERSLHRCGIQLYLFIYIDACSVVRSERLDKNRLQGDEAHAESERTNMCGLLFP